MRKLVLTILAAAWLLAPPAAEAQVLGTWCTPNFMQPTSSAQLQACYDLRGYSTTTYYYGDGEDATLSFSGLWYGSFFTALADGTASMPSSLPLWSPWVQLPDGRVFNNDLIVFDPAYHTQLHTFTTLRHPTTGVPAPTLNEILDPSVTVFEITGLPQATLVSVPEPATYLLILTGMMGLGMVAWRRTKEALS